MNHKLDLGSIVEQTQYLGIDINEFVSIAEQDGWEVEVFWGDRNNIITLQSRGPDHIFCREKNGRVIALGDSVFFCSDKE